MRRQQNQIDMNQIGLFFCGAAIGVVMLCLLGFAAKAGAGSALAALFGLFIAAVSLLWFPVCVVAAVVFLVKINNNLSRGNRKGRRR